MQPKLLKWESMKEMCIFGNYILKKKQNITTTSSNMYNLISSQLIKTNWLSVTYFNEKLFMSYNVYMFLKMIFSNKFNLFWTTTLFL